MGYGKGNWRYRDVDYIDKSQSMSKAQDLTPSQGCRDGWSE